MKIISENHMKRRSRMEIYIDILEAVGKGKRKPTHIMYRANLTWIRLNKHLDLLIGRGLLKEEESDGHTVFSLTHGGKDVLGYYMEMKRGLLCKKKDILSKVSPIIRS